MALFSHKGTNYNPFYIFYFLFYVNQSFNSGSNRVYIHTQKKRKYTHMVKLTLSSFHSKPKINVKFL